MKPIVAVVCDTNQQGPHIYHQAGDKYLQALVRCADVTPVLIPSLDDPISAAQVIDVADGILFTGGYSNIERHHYGLDAAPESEHQDPHRDKNTLPLMKAVVDAGLPMLGICRGFQELNVTFGGTLHPRLHEVEGRMDHREDKNTPVEEQYGFAHNVSVCSGGLLENIVGDHDFMVNSVHGQGIDRLADGLVAEALAADETIEAVSVEGAKAFALAVQWHPEWKAWENRQSTQIFNAFGDAVRKHKQAKPKKTIPN